MNSTIERKNEGIGIELLTKNTKEKENNIYNKLKRIQSKHISKKGQEISRQFKKLCIKGFLNQYNLRKELNHKLHDEKYKDLKPRDNGTVESEIMQLIDPYNRIQPTIDFDQSVNDMIKNLTQSSTQRSLNKQRRKLKSSYSNEKYHANPELLRYIHLINHKKPPSCMYNPNYFAIAPHVPCVKIRPKNQSLSYTKPNILQSRITQFCSRNYKANSKMPKCNNRHGMSFEKYSSRNEIFIKKAYKDSVLDPLKIHTNISVPNFKKMSSRHKSRNDEMIPAVYDYHPNYSYFYENKFGTNSNENPKLKLRKNKLRKVLNGNISTSQYLAFPELNK